jgi:hypothetical protein
LVKTINNNFTAITSTSRLALVIPNTTLSLARILASRLRRTITNGRWLWITASQTRINLHLARSIINIILLALILNHPATPITTNLYWRNCNRRLGSNLRLATLYTLGEQFVATTRNRIARTTIRSLNLALLLARIYRIRLRSNSHCNSRLCFSHNRTVNQRRLWLSLAHQNTIPLTFISGIFLHTSTLASSITIIIRSCNGSSNCKSRNSTQQK